VTTAPAEELQRLPADDPALELLAKAGGLPNGLPRPEGELESLKAIWQPPRGWRFVTVVNNNYIGTFYLGTALLFFLLAGLLALIMRTQLAVPDNDIVGQELYNQLFTMHGTIMMFLFAVPAVEAMGVLLLPNMLGARDLPFPRLSAYAFWAYFVGGLVFFTSIFFGLAPDGGWFMYPPLTSERFSPGINADFWLLGIGFIEISAIAGAIEIVVGVLRTRSPGMTLDRMPLFAWAMLVFAAMIIFAFPAIIFATILLEVERAFGWPYFLADLGGDPLLWQHLFWFFGHPEVYIIFLPAAGMLSMIIPTVAQRPLVGYRLVVLALVATGALGFGLWVHHMYATGIPQLSLSFFSAASMAVSIPSGIQVFAWIATLAGAHDRIRLTTPALFSLGAVFTFVMGGLSGVMVAVVPFDWQAHDTYFVVAHLHYVLFGGMVMPLFAALYYWVPYASKRALSETLGRWVFGLVFVGFHVAFFPMHVTGLAGMPRRVWTYAPELGVDLLNLVSTVGAFTIGAGVLLLVCDMARNFRIAGERNAGNVWKAGTLEWLPSGNYSNRSIPIVTSREPLWEQPDLAEHVEQGRYYLPNTASGGRETIMTSAIDARPQALLQMPGPSLPTFLAAVFTAFFFLALTVKLYAVSIVCAAVAVGAMIRWLWETDPGPTHPPLPVGGNLWLPVYVTGPASHSWWATMVVILVAGSIFSCHVFSYLYLWLVSPRLWPGSAALPEGWRPIASAALLAASGAMVALAGRALRADLAWPFRLLLGLAVPSAVASIVVEVGGQLGTGLAPTESAYGAMVYLTSALQGFFVAVVATMAIYTVARSCSGRLDARRRATFDNTMLMWHYTVAQGLVGLALLHIYPRLTG
jgi:cytochrome c oxidase subunit I+III